MSNIQVVVRCRGRNSQEIAAKSPIVVELTNDNYSITEPYITINQGYTRATATTTTNNTTTTNSNNTAGATPNTSASSLDTNLKRTYKFDQIYGSQADQNLIYSQIAHPLLLDFLRGINVTVLAYGQTGTGKTYTMSGMDNNNKLDENSDIAGIIPRLLGELFQNLSSNATSKNDYMVKISYLEIYNEELIDLLSNNNSNNRKLRIHEKTNANKVKSIGIQNLTEYTINNYNQGIKYLKMGLQKKKTSSTNLNETSSRSHTIFSVQLYQKISSSSSSENDNEESVYRISKMNLVDLAGSENISRSGSIVKEAGGINQSLLTLGRVINSLNEKKLLHIPYRESKLTHILQDSLGGNTKTTLIATISPAQVNLLETCSTLDYASKAKNIKNAPMIGHDSEIIMKKTLVKNLAQELTLLNMDLIATRNKNGVYLDPENYDQLIQENESLKTGAKEDRLKLELLQAKIETLEFTKLEAKEEIDNLKQQLQSYQLKLQILETKYHKAVGLNQTNQETICELNNKLKRAFEKSSSSAELLVNLLSNHLHTSIGLVNESRNLQQDNKSVDQLTNFQLEFTKNLDEYKQQLETNLQNYQSQVGNIVNEDLTNYISTFQKNFDNLLTFQQEFYNKTFEVIQDFKIINEKLSGFLKDDYLHNIETNLNSQLGNILGENLPILVDNFKKIMTKELKTTMNNVMDKYKTVSNEEISKERENVLKMENSWNSQINCLLPKLETDLNNNNKFHHDCQTNLQKFINNNDICERINKFQQDNNSQLDKINPFDLKPKLTSSINGITNDIQQYHNQMNTNLTKINQELTQIQQFDANTMKISPIKESSRIPITTANMPNNQFKPIKLHRSNTTCGGGGGGATGKSPSPTRIPTLQRSKSNVPEDTSPQDSTTTNNNKKRKILQTMDNLL